MLRLMRFAVFCLFLVSFTCARAEEFVRDGKSYQYVEYETLYGSGWQGWPFLRDSPSIYNGMRVVTTGWIGEHCEFRSYASEDLRSPVAGNRLANPGYIRLYWLRSSEPSQTVATQQCGAFAAQSSPLSNSSFEFAVALYGIVRNGTGATVGECTNGPTSNLYPFEPNRRCLHIDVENVRFLDAARTSRQFVTETGSRMLLDAAANYLAKKLRGPG